MSSSRVLKPVYIIADKSLHDKIAGSLASGESDVYLLEDTGVVEAAGNLPTVICIDKPCFQTGSENVIIFSTKRVKSPPSYTRHYLRRVDWGVYSFETPGEGERVVITLDKGVLREGSGLTVVEEKALELVKEAMINYGELKVGDVVFIISRELGVTKERAREILSKLVARRYLRVRKGSIELA
ncbi:hypothetical protein ACSU1N_03750 [Thermogladius sp. 4427co]|uniref:hypothetical protein n=1 Tax=Thermogladius sp. 4427co TaxID=3450718 RepID=UPI003F79ACC3